MNIFHQVFQCLQYKHVMCRGKDCMKKFCKFLREHAMEIIDFGKKKMKLLPKEQQEPCENSKICDICKEKFENRYLKDKEYGKVRDHCHYAGEYGGAGHSVYNLQYSVPKKISVVFRNGSNYDYHFIIKELAKEFEKHLACLGEIIEKYITL